MDIHLVFIVDHSKLYKPSILDNEEEEYVNLSSKELVVEVNVDRRIYSSNWKMVNKQLGNFETTY